MPSAWLREQYCCREKKKRCYNPSASKGSGAGLLNLTDRFDEVDRVRVVLLDASRHSEDIGVEYDVLRREPSFFSEKFVGALADANLFLKSGGLSLFVKSHDYGGRPVSL